MILKPIIIKGDGCICPTKFGQKGTSITDLRYQMPKHVSYKNPLKLHNAMILNKTLLIHSLIILFVELFRGRIPTK